MKKQAIVIASVLKPVNDTRMFEKMGRSLVKANQWDVHIIGFGDTSSEEPGITFQPLGSFPRISWRRVLSPIKVLVKFLSIKPAVIIVATHELLIPAILYKLFSGAKISYDVRENYYLNIRNTRAFPFLARFSVAWTVRTIEWLSSPFVSRFILAEKCYSDELPFLGSRFTIVENKCNLPNGFKRSPNQKGIRLVFSGTLDESTGIFESVELVKQLNAIDKSVHLHIIGYCALAPMRKRILEAIKGQSFITIEGLDHLVEHKRIFEELSHAHAGIIYYPAQPHLQNRVPTKLYEYTACQLPILYDKQASWSPWANEMDAGIAIDSRQFNALEILDRLKKGAFYSRLDSSPLWETEETTFLTALSQTQA